MTSAEEFTQAFEYLDKLPCWIWHDFKDVPEEIANRVFTLVDSNTFSKDIRIQWCEQSQMSDFFMKTEVANYNLKI